MTRACRPFTAWRPLAAFTWAVAVLAAAPAGTDTCSTLDVGPTFSQTTGLAPVAVVAADFDRDGKTDVVTANSGSDSVSLMLGDGQGALGPAVSAAAGASPLDLAVGDLDRDGFLDLVAAGGRGTTVALLRGTGTGFEAPILFDTGIVPRRVALADFDRDGQLDLVVVSESGNQVRLFAGTGAMAFGALLASPTVASPVASAPGDFNHDGKLDLAVASRGASQVVVFLGDGRGFLGNGAGAPTPAATVATGAAPLDVVAGDVDRDGRLDLVTADSGAGTASVLLGTGTGGFTLQAPVPVGGQPIRVALADLDRDGTLDLVALDATAPAPRLAVFRGKGASPFFATVPDGAAVLPASSAPGGLAIGRFSTPGRPDLVTALSGTNAAVLVPNLSGSTCLRASFGGAPRSYPVGDGPVAAAAADFDEDGRSDLVVAASVGLKIQVLRGASGGFGSPEDYPVALAPKGVAAADFNLDGHADVVSVLGASGSGAVQILLGDGTGRLYPQPAFAAGDNPAAVVVGDFDGNGVPDVALASQGTNQVLVFLGDGTGNLGPPIATAVGLGPQALATGFFDRDARLDLAVACADGKEVRVLLGSGDGHFTAGSTLSVGASPWGIAAGDVDANGTVDLVTADRGVDPDYRASVFKGNGDGTFEARLSYPVDPLPTSVALMRVDDSPRPDIVVSTASLHTVNVLLDDGAGGFLPASRYAVRTRPQAVVPVDVDGDGRPDVVLPCKGSNAVAVLLVRPPNLLAATRVATGRRPQGAAAADLDGDGQLDLVVANTGSDSVSVLLNDRAGGFKPLSALTLSAGAAPTGVVVADFDRDGVPDVAANDAAGGRVAVFRGRGDGTFEDPRWFPAGASPDDLAAADVDRDGDLDLLVCNKVPAGTVSLLRNVTPAGGPITFTDPRNPGPAAPPDIVAVGDNPTSIFVDDFDRDGRLDLAVANDRSGSTTGPYTLTVLYGDGTGLFPRVTNLDLAGGQTPFAVTGGDFDGDGDVDLAVAEWGTDTVSVFENRGGAFSSPPVRVPAPDVPVHVVAADLNRDGKPDLAVVATGLSVRRGPLLPLDPSATRDDFVAGLAPAFVVVADFNGDGWPDAAVVNGGSDDVSILLSTACTARRLEVTLQPAACGAGPAPYPLEATLEAHDDGGNLAACASGDVTAAIAPGTGAAGAQLSGTAYSPPRVTLASGVASFASSPSPSNALIVDRPGRHFRLQFSLPGLPPAVSRSFTLGPQPSILGPTSFCPGTSALYGAEDVYDTYAWTLTPPGAPPFAYTPAVTLAEPRVSVGLGYTLALSARVDGCAAGAFRPIWYGGWQKTTLSIAGLATVCVDCVGGTVTPTDQGGGAAVARQWGYRTVAGGPITPLAGETAPTYVVKGTDFPGPGTYRLVVTSTLTCPSAPGQVSEELPLTVSSVVPDGEVQFLAATSRGTGTAGESLLQWFNSIGHPDEVRIRWLKSPTGTSSCTAPLSPDGGTGVEQQVFTPAPGETRSQWLHAPLEPGTAYCYGVFVRQGTTWAPGRIIKARPFDASGPVKWAYSTGATAVVPPAVGTYGVLAMSNDLTVHAVERGSTGGAWPANWVPHAQNGVSHSRSPVVPLATPIGGADSVLFVGDDLGWIEAVDARTGQGVWQTRAPASPAQAIVTGAPAAILRQYGGSRDLVLVGTRRDPAAGASDFLGLDLANPAPAEVFKGGGTPFKALGPVSGSPAVDYARQRVYFASRRLGAGDTIWALDASATPIGYAWSLDPGGEFDTSPVVRGDRLYAGDTNGVVYSIAVSGAPPAPGDVRSMTTGDGAVKGFLFPDRRNDDLFFATDTKVWSVADTAGGFLTNWTWTAPGLSPSIVLYAPGTSNVYFGGSNGRLYQLDFSYDPASPEFAKSVTLGDGTGRIGAPSLDIGLLPPAVATGKQLLLVGSESGVLYGVEVPLP